MRLAYFPGRADVRDSLTSQVTTALLPGHPSTAVPTQMGDEQVLTVQITFLQLYFHLFTSGSERSTFCQDPARHRTAEFTLCAHRAAFARQKPSQKLCWCWSKGPLPPTSHLQTLTLKMTAGNDLRGHFLQLPTPLSHFLGGFER